MKNNNEFIDDMDFKDIFEEINGTLTSFNSIPHEEVLKALLETISYVDFKSKINPKEEDFTTTVEAVAVNAEEKTAPKKKRSKVKKKDYHVLVIEEVLRIARQKHWGLCKKNSAVYLYNGAFWKQISEDDLKQFLGKAAAKMGVPKLESKHFSFRDDLYKQFLGFAVLESFKQPEDTILINLQNDTFEITPNGRDLRSFAARDFLTYQLPFEYDESATAPKFQKYLNEVLPDKACQKILAEYFGYVFTRNIKMEKILLLYGSGANGKSVFFDIINAILGRENVTNYSLESLTNTNGYQRANLGDSLVNYASEVSGKLNQARFKQLASGEPIDVRLPYSKPFILYDYAKLVFNCNELPKEVEQTEAYFRRFLIIPFTVTIPEKKRDKDLAKKIIASELSGVFNWILKGLDRLLEKQKFTESKAVQNQLEEYRKESNTVLLYISENGYKKSTKKYYSINMLYQHYRGFCNDFGVTPVNKINFNKRLKSAGYHVKRNSKGYLVNIDVKEIKP